jgi:hypothetical protein
LLCRLRRRCTRQRWRRARGKHVSTARRAIGDHQQRIGEAPALEVFEERRAARRVFLRARSQVQQDLPPVVGQAPRAEHGFAGQPGVQPLSDAVDKQVGLRKLAQVPARGTLRTPATGAQ